MLSRRKFIQHSGAAALAAPLLMNHALAGTAPKMAKNPICIFSKHLQWLDFEDLGKYVSDIGIAGVDLTVRKGGHIEPENAPQQLPDALDKIRKSGTVVPMIATNINSADDPLTEPLLKAAGANEVKYYRMAYYKYDDKLGVEENLLALRPVAARLADMNAKYGIHGAYQNHSGTRVGASVWDIWYVIKDLDPRWLGVQFDIRHAVVEGGESWVNDFALIKDFVRCSVAKDFYWKKTESGWKINNVPMGEGMVDFVKYYKMYKDFGLDGPISLHIEYDIFDQPEETLSKQEKMKFARQVLAKDIQHLKDALAKAGLE